MEETGAQLVRRMPQRLHLELREQGKASYFVTRNNFEGSKSKLVFSKHVLWLVQSLGLLLKRGNFNGTTKPFALGEGGRGEVGVSQN